MSDASAVIPVLPNYTIGDLQMGGYVLTRVARRADGTIEVAGTVNPAGLAVALCVLGPVMIRRAATLGPVALAVVGPAFFLLLILLVATFRLRIHMDPSRKSVSVVRSRFGMTAKTFELPFSDVTKIELRYAGRISGTQLALGTASGDAILGRISGKIDVSELKRELHALFGSRAEETLDAAAAAALRTDH